MTQAPLISTIRELVRAYQAFEVRSAEHIRSLGLTPAQFDVVATLGNTPGITPTLLTQKTLITKGTLTGIVDRLSAKGFVTRTAHEVDGRSQLVKLTKKGERLFEKAFPAHLAHMERFFVDYSAEDHAQIQAVLGRLRNTLKKEAS
jgi:DNA-binding MarR family transcriptional regulator